MPTKEKTGLFKISYMLIWTRKFGMDQGNIKLMAREMRFLVNMEGKKQNTV
jgi:hypothetical protein